MDRVDFLLQKWNEKADPSVFNNLINEDNFRFFSLIIEKLHNNFIVKDNYCLQQNYSLLVVITQLNTDDDAIETFLFKRLSKMFCAFTNYIYSEKNQTTITNLHFKNLEMFIDYFFHNPTFVNFLEEVEIEHFIASLINLSHLKNDNLNADWLRTLEHSVNVFLYFPDEYVERHKLHYLNHPNHRIVEEFFESY